MKPILLLLVLAATAHAKILKIEAGPHDRANTVVTVPAPDDVPENPGLKAADGKILPLQLSDDGTATFILPELAAGKTAFFELVTMDEVAEDIALAKENGGDVVLHADKLPVANFVRNRQSCRVMISRRCFCAEVTCIPCGHLWEK